MGSYYSPFSLRVPEKILNKIKAIAKKNKRSANKEMEFALQKYIEEGERKNGDLKEME